MIDEYGSLVIITSIADGASPVEGVVIRIVGADEDNYGVLYTLTTDTDGRSAIVSLPTKDRADSLKPNGDGIPYSKYDLEVTKEGYYTKRIKGVSIFSGIESIQPISMIPLSDTAIKYFPDGNVNVIIPDTDI